MKTPEPIRTLSPLPLLSGDGGRLKGTSNEPFKYEINERYIPFYDGLWVIIASLMFLGAALRFTQSSHEDNS